MSAAAELFVRVSADIKGLTSGFGAAAQAADGLGKSVNTAAGHYIDANGRMRDANGRFVGSAGEAAGAAQGLAGGLDGVTRKAFVFGDVLKGLTLAAVAAGVASVGKRAITLAAELEQAKIGFTTMLGGAKQADQFLRDLTQFAATTPFELRGLVDSSKRLLAFGFEAKGVIPIMTAVGNAVAGLGGGKEVLDGVTTALGQMAAKGKVSAEEMNQLAERGIPAWKMLADGIGVSIPQAMKMAEKGAIDANTAIVSIINGMNEKFPDMMAKQSQSFSGAMSNLQDSADIALTKIGTAIIEAFHITPMIQAMSAVIGELTESISERGLQGAVDAAGRAFVEMGAASKVVVLGLAAAFATVAIPAVITFGTAAVSAIVSATLAFAPMLAAVAAVAAGAYVIIRNWDLIREAVWYAMDNASQAVQGLRNAIVRQFNDVRGIVNDAMMYIGLLFRETFGDKIANALGVGLAKAGGYVSRFSESTTTHLSGWAKSTSGSMSAAAKSALDGARDIGSVLSDSVRYAMDDVTSQLTLGYGNAASAAKAATGKVTAEMLGLKAAAKSAGDAVKKAGSGKKAAAAAAKELAQKTKDAAQETRSFFQGLAGFINSYRDQVKVSKDFAAAIQEVEKQAAAQGRSFDLAGAKATVFKQNLKDIEKAFGEFSVQAVTARANMAAYAESSANGGAATAKAYEVIDGAAQAMERAAFTAQALGKEWDGLTEGIKSAEGVLVKLIDQGLRPGNKAYDEAAGKLAALKKALVQVQPEATKLTDDLSGIAGSLSRLGGSLSTLGAGNIGSIFSRIGDLSSAAIGIVVAFEGLAKIGVVLGKVGGIIGGVVAGVVAIGGAIAALPLAAVIGIVVGIGLAIAAIAYHWEPVKNALVAGWNWIGEQISRATYAIRTFLGINTALAEQQRQQREEEARAAEEAKQKAIKDAEEAGEAMKKFGDSLRSSVGSAIKQATIAFIAGADDWKDKLRQNMKEAIFNGLMDAIISRTIIKQFDDIIDQIVDAYDKGNQAGAEKLFNDMVEKATKTAETLGTAAVKFLESIGVGGGDAMQMARQAMGAVTSTKGNASAIATYQAAQQSHTAILTRLSNVAGGRESEEYKRSLDAANRLSEAIRMEKAGQAVPATFFGGVDNTLNKSRSLAVLPGLATGGLVTGPTMARLGEGGRNEAVLPLNENVYRQIGQGIAAARGGGGGAQVVVQYYGNGKWTREDAQGLGRLLVSELRTMGVKA